MAWANGQMKKNSYATRRAREGWSSDEYGTPWSLVRWLERELGFGFELDPAATERNAKAPIFHTKENSGLAHQWFGTVFCNPPFSAVEAWIRKGLEEAGDHRAFIAMVVPVRTETYWWHELVMPYAEIWFQRGRQRFLDPTGTDIGRPVFSSAILVMVPGLPPPGRPRSVPSIRNERDPGDGLA